MGSAEGPEVPVGWGVVPIVLPESPAPAGDVAGGRGGLVAGGTCLSFSTVPSPSPDRRPGLPPSAPEAGTAPRRDTPTLLQL